MLRPAQSGALMGKAEVAPEDAAWLTRIRGTGADADPDSPDDGR